MQRRAAAREVVLPVPATFLRHTPMDATALAVQIDRSRSQLGCALAVGDAKQILDHAGALVGMLTAAGREGEGLSLGLGHVGMARSHSTLEESAWLLHSLATAAQYSNDRPRANALFAEALESARCNGWRRLEHFVLHHWGRSRVEEQDFDAAERCFVESRSIRKETDPALVASSERALLELAKLRMHGGTQAQSKGPGAV